MMAKETELTDAHGRLVALRAELYTEDRSDKEESQERLIQRLENDLIALGLVEAHAWNARLVTTAKE